MGPERPIEDWEFPEPDSDEDETVTIQCPECGEEVYEEADYCPNCNADLEGRLQTSAFAGRPIWYILLALAGSYAFLEAFVLP